MNQYTIVFCLFAASLRSHVNCYLGKNHLMRKKITILTFFTEKVPINSQSFECVTNLIFRHGHIIGIILEFEVINFEPEKRKPKVV